MSTSILNSSVPQATPPTQQVWNQQLKDSFQALRDLVESKSDNIAIEKQNFEIITLCFKKMKGLNNDLLPEYVNLMHQLVDFLHSPKYINFYKKYDKKLTKNMIKRCFVEPFSDKFMKYDGDDPHSFELARFKSHPNVLEKINSIFN